MTARPCLCIFEYSCSGTGTIYCHGCGGDLCICTCGGSIECDGCLYCDNTWEWPTDEDEAEIESLREDKT